MAIRCGTMLAENDGMAEAIARIEARVAARQATPPAEASPPVLASLPPIRVVVHLVYNTPEQKISDAQVQSQIAVLNADYSGSNPDIRAVPAYFVGAIGSPKLSFALATLDPDGNPTSRITYTPTDKTEFSDNDDVKFMAEGGIDGWDSNRYLNLWVCHLVNKDDPRIDLLGYSQMPGGPASTDGVVIAYTAFGLTGAAGANNLGRTATHEIGHWLGLHHLWGDGYTDPVTHTYSETNPFCELELGVYDTPQQAAPSKGKPTGPQVSCNNGPNGDMYMNFMDYTDDAAMVMFTQGQAARMRAMLTEVRTPQGRPLVASTPALLGVPAGDERGGFHSKLWLCFTEAAPDKKVWLLSSDDGKTWEVSTTDATGMGSKSAPSMAVLNKQMWITTMLDQPTSELLLSMTQDSTRFMFETYFDEEGWETAAAASLTPFNNEVWVAFLGASAPNAVNVGPISALDPFYTATGVTSTMAPSLTAFENSGAPKPLWLAYTAQTTNAASTVNKLAVISSADGKTWSAPVFVQPSPPDQADSNCGPAIIAWKNALWLAYTGLDGGVGVRSSADGVSWQPPTLINAAQSQFGPALAVFQGQLWLAFVSSNPEFTNQVVVLASDDGARWDLTGHFNLEALMAA
jgi:hypothetical protein